MNGRIGSLPKRITGRVLREGARRLPVSSQVLGPPRGVLPTTSDWCHRHADEGARFTSLAPAQNASVTRPLALEELPDKYLRQLQAKTPERFVAFIPQGRVCYTGVTLTPDDYVLGDTTYLSHLDAFKNGNLPILQSLKLPSLQKQKGAVGVLASMWTDNYYHWLFDAVPRLHLLQQAGIAIDKFVVAQNKAFQKQTLDLLGIAENQRIADEPNLHLLAETLIVPSLPGGQGNPPRWICEFLRETLSGAALQEYSQSESAASPRRIYISRAAAGGRRVTNENEVLEILRAYHFETTTLENFSVAQQISWFRNAQAIVAPHGAALSNLVFCRPGTCVLEFFAPGWAYPVYNFIGAQSGLRCACLIGKGARPLPENDARCRDADITIDLRELEKMLRLLEL